MGVDEVGFCYEDKASEIFFARRVFFLALSRDLDVAPSDRLGVCPYLSRAVSEEENGAFLPSKKECD